MQLKSINITQAVMDIEEEHEEVSFKLTIVHITFSRLLQFI